MNWLPRYQAFVKHSIPDFWFHPLWRRRRWAPFLRFARLQVMFALGRRRLMLPWLAGLRLPVVRGDSGLTGNYYMGLHEFKDMGFVTQMLREGDLFVDVGANLGSYSLLAAGVAGARCLAFEPVPRTCVRLEEVMACNGLQERVRVRNLALAGPESVAAGEQVLFSCDRDCYNKLVSDSYEGEKIYVDIATLDAECSDLEPRLMKVDVEGFELDVLRGSAQTLRKASLMAVVIEGQLEAVNEIFRSNGFDDYDYDPLQRRLLPLRGFAPNRIWVRRARLAEVEQRLAAAPVREVYGSRF